MTAGWIYFRSVRVGSEVYGHLLATGITVKCTILHLACSQLPGSVGRVGQQKGWAVRGRLTGS